MVHVHSLLDHDAVDQWVRHAQAELRSALQRPDAPAMDCQWLLRRCDDTLRYEGEMKYESTLHLIEDLEMLASEFPGTLPDDLTVTPRALVAEPASRRFLNG